MSKFTIRPIDESEWAEYDQVLQEAFNSEGEPAFTERFRALLTLDRTLAVFDGGTMIGTTAVTPFTMTVPGGPAPVAGVTAVAVLPSHRRRGVLSSLMRRQLTDLHEAGEPLAALYATEAAIYGRFGYGRASDTLAGTIPAHRSAFRRDAPADPALRLRVARPAEARKDFERIFDTVMTGRPGHYSRTAARWDALLADDETARHGDGPLRCLLAEDDGEVRGYALFRVRNGVTDYDVPDSELRLRELHATDPAAYALLWRGVLDRDLVGRVRTWSRPVDDPIVDLLAEPRHFNAVWLDELWVRLVDVGDALVRRAYAAPVDLVLAVEDDVCPWNAGRWRLSADESGAVCETTSAPADITLPASALGAAYLGGRSLSGLTGATVVREETPGAVRRLSAAMSWEPRPWAGLVF
ncbi:UPF0256 protein [Microtetraspora sp. NBRC 13810]|uniref:GNAT family N-acetyltransferase n=1 Tax=Microtetraspora sp. NBRC 13810 TaxID=3030990 RepID=UPI0024A0251E|nr:GNAT family N-acetyltransferase [Microtetraspora sp. NBRC 13810]GLW10845.1 UPF0256 protein [Microtetraspora sp. NBRC 13810]